MTKPKKEKRNKNWKLNRMAPEEIKQLARDIVTNIVYITNSEEGLRHSFGLMLSAVASKAPKKEFMKIGACYAEYSKAAPRGVNGYPMFFGCSLVHKDDMPMLRAEIWCMEKALGIVSPPPPIPPKIIKETKTLLVTERCEKTGYGCQEYKECGQETKKGTKKDICIFLVRKTDKTFKGGFKGTIQRSCDL